MSGERFTADVELPRTPEHIEAMIRLVEEGYITPTWRDEEHSPDDELELMQWQAFSDKLLLGRLHLRHCIAAEAASNGCRGAGSVAARPPIRACRAIASPARPMRPGAAT